jgi:hypothetical protein
VKNVEFGLNNNAVQKYISEARKGRSLVSINTGSGRET